MSVVQKNRKEGGNFTVLFFPSGFGVKKKPWQKKVIIEPQKVCIFSNFGLDTKFGWRFFFFTPPDPEGKKNRKIGHQRGREEIVCDYREKIKPYHIGMDIASLSAVAETLLAFLAKMGKIDHLEMGFISKLGSRLDKLEIGSLTYIPLTVSKWTVSHKRAFDACWFKVITGCRRKKKLPMWPSSFAFKNIGRTLITVAYGLPDEFWGHF